MSRTPPIWATTRPRRNCVSSPFPISWRRSPLLASTRCLRGSSSARPPLRLQPPQETAICSRSTSAIRDRVASGACLRTAPAGSGLFDRRSRPYCCFEPVNNALCKAGEWPLCVCVDRCGRHDDRKHQHACRAVCHVALTVMVGPALLSARAKTRKEVCTRGFALLDHPDDFTEVIGHFPSEIPSLPSLQRRGPGAHQRQSHMEKGERP